VASELRSAMAATNGAMNALRGGQSLAGTQAAIDRARVAIRPVRHGLVGRELARLLTEVERCAGAAVRRSVLLDGIDWDVTVALAVKPQTW
jgi:hypothetical protein